MDGTICHTSNQIPVFVVISETLWTNKFFLPGPLKSHFLTKIGEKLRYFGLLIVLRTNILTGPERGILRGAEECCYNSEYDRVMYPYKIPCWQQADAKKKMIYFFKSQLVLSFPGSKKCRTNSFPWTDVHLTWGQSYDPCTKEYGHFTNIFMEWLTTQLCNDFARKNNKRPSTIFDFFF